MGSDSWWSGESVRPGFARQMTTQKAAVPAGVEEAGSKELLGSPSLGCGDMDQNLRFFRVVFFGPGPSARKKEALNWDPWLKEEVGVWLKAKELGQTAGFSLWFHRKSAFCLGSKLHLFFEPQPSGSQSRGPALGAVDAWPRLDGTGGHRHRAAAAPARLGPVPGGAAAAAAAPAGAVGSASMGRLRWLRGCFGVFGSV